MLQIRARDVHGIRCAVHEAGDLSSAEAVVFVHGNPGPLDDWEFALPQVASFARVVAMDLPGFGRADRPRGFSYSLEAYARYLAELLDQLGIRRVHLVAHDFGGLWGASWALRRPEALASLTLIDSPVCPDFEWHFWAKVWHAPVVGELLQTSTWGGLITWVMNRDNPRRFPRAFTERVVRFADRAQKFAVLDIYRQCREPARDFAPLYDGLRRLDVPVCLIWGAQDPYAKPEVARRLHQALPRAALHLIEEAGHWPFIDAPEEVRSILCGFLRQQLRMRAA